MAEIIIGGGCGYLEKYFIKRLHSALLAIANEETHICGFCENYDPLEGRYDYGYCELCSRTLGFDCSFGNSCDHFKRAKKVEFEIKVVE